MDQVKILITLAFILRLPDFSDTLVVTCDASQVRIGGLLCQEKYLINFLSEKLNKVHYSTYDREFYLEI